ncbi:MAG: hypothetical protein ACI94Y_001189 [Maribacter sp.]|jgi:uncharacterized protein (DUF58 family)
METKELLQKVRKIEIKTKGMSKHLFSGAYHSTFKGRGMSFSEVRNYFPGDDVRTIDWNVTARTNEPYIKVFEEERELTAVLLVDVSRSSMFGTTSQMKSEFITEISAVLAFSAIQNNDKVGVIFFSDKVEKFIPPKKGKQHILRIIRELLDFRPESNGTNLGVAIRYLNNVIKKRSIAFILSDFLTEGYDNALRVAAKKHDIIGLRIYDPRDETLPNIGLVRMADAETGRKLWIDTASKSVRDKYESFNKNLVNNFKTLFSKAGKDTVSIRTDESYEKALLGFFKGRR